MRSGILWVFATLYQSAMREEFYYIVELYIYMKLKCEKITYLHQSVRKSVRVLLGKSRYYIQVYEE